MKDTRKLKRTAAAFAAVIATAFPLCGNMTASATTVGDVIGAAYAAGWPDWMIQEAINTYSGGNYTSEQCDRAISMIYQYDEEVAKQIEEQYGIKGPVASTTTAAPDSNYYRYNKA